VKALRLLDFVSFEVENLSQTRNLELVGLFRLKKIRGNEKREQDRGGRADERQISQGPEGGREGDMGKKRGKRKEKRMIQRRK